MGIICFLFKIVNSEWHIKGTHCFGIQGERGKKRKKEEFFDFLGQNFPSCMLSHNMLCLENTHSYATWAHFCNISYHSRVPFPPPHPPAAMAEKFHLEKEILSQFTYSLQGACRNSICKQLQRFETFVPCPFLLKMFIAIPGALITTPWLSQLFVGVLPNPLQAESAEIVQTV